MAPLPGKSSPEQSEEEFENAAGFNKLHEPQKLLRKLLASSLPELPWYAATSGTSNGEHGKKLRSTVAPQRVPWNVWATVLTAVVCVWDPMRIRHLIAASRNLYPTKCENPGVECCRPVADINEWPADPDNKLLRSEFFSNTSIPGPETLAWDLQGQGPYAGVADGRVIRWNKNDKSWETFAYASPYWTHELCSYRNRRHNLDKLEHVCGRPLGLTFHPFSGALYIADAYFGLAVVGQNGGLADLLCNKSEGIAHTFTNDVAIANDGVIYFTVSSTRRQRRECNIMVMEGDRTGRLLEYDPSTKNSTVLLRGMRYPNGLAVAKDGTFLLIALTSINRVVQYWREGAEAGNLNEFAHQPGYPDNIRSTENGDFWVALHGRRTKMHVWICHIPWEWALRVVFSLSRTYKTVGSFLAGHVTVMAMKYNVKGEVIDVLEDRTHSSHTQFLSNAQERDGTLWLSSIYTPIISVYKIARSNKHIPPTP